MKRRLLIGVAVAYVGALLLAPVLQLLWNAFGTGLRPFLVALSAPDVRHALAMTGYLTVFAVLFNGVFGTAVAFVLVRDPGFRARRFLNGLVDVPFAVSPVIAGFVLIEMFGRTGLFGPFLASHGIKIAFAWPGMAIATAFVSLPFVIREVAPVLDEIGTEQEVAAYTLGASPFTTFVRVTLPSIRWGLLYGVTLTAARAIGEFGAVLVVSGGVAGKTETATSFIYRALEDRNDVGAAAVALLLALASIALLLGMDALKRRRSGDGEARA